MLEVRHHETSRGVILQRKHHNPTNGSVHYWRTTVLPDVISMKRLWLELYRTVTMAYDRTSPQNKKASNLRVEVQDKDAEGKEEDDD